MNTPYDGIRSDAIWLLSQNKFENSKDFYEAHKEEIKQRVLNPMRQIAAALGEDMLKLDPLMRLDPSRAVSRVRRDTRFTKDKTLYRDHIWLSFDRPKPEFFDYPGFWMEIQPGGYNYGMGYFGPSPAYMDFYRKRLLERESEFLEAVKPLLENGAVAEGEEYKHPKPGSPASELAAYYNRKTLYFPKSVQGHENLADERIIAELREAFAKAAPLYRFMTQVSDDFLSMAK